MSSRFYLRRFVLVAISLGAALLAHAQSEHVIVFSSGSSQNLKRQVAAVGGTVQQEFQNVTAVSAIVPNRSVAALSAIPQFSVRKAGTVFNPRPLGPRGLRGVLDIEYQGHIKFDAATIVKNAQTRPADYVFNNSLIDLSPLHAQGNLGRGVIVAQIDSGTANNPDLVFALDGAVIGGESLVPRDEDSVFSATSTKNDPHGTWVATMIAGNTGFLLPNTSCLARSLRRNAPDSTFDATPYGFPGDQVLPLIGVAPAAKIYTLKVFPSTGGGAPEDRIIAAMDRVLTLKKNFLAGKPSVPVSGTGTEDDPYIYDSLNIQVLNMSLGGPTQAAGRDAEDLLSQELLKAGIVLAASAGNAGPALLTTGSPSTGLGSISAAAANVPSHERVFWDLGGASSCSVGLGMIARPSDAIQTAYFSSRGPTKDGRVGTDVTSAGYVNLAQGADGGLYIVSGTSFTAPTVAGAAALLRVAAPKATATQIRNALILGANPHVVTTSASVIEQGAGYLDVAHSLDLLRNQKVFDFLPPFPAHSGDVAVNALKFGIKPTYLEPGQPLTFSPKNIAPGEAREFLVHVGPDGAQVQVQVNSVDPKLGPAQQNQLFGDDVLLAVHQAKTSSFAQGDYPLETFVNRPSVYTIKDPEPGYLRLVILGDWTNAGPVSASVTLTVTNVGPPAFTHTDSIKDGDFQFVPFTVPPGLSSIRFELTWKDDWNHYPANDLDLIVLDPQGNEIDDGATLNGRELADIASPKPGQWTLVVSGANIFGHLQNDGSQTGPRSDTYQLRAFEQ